MSIAGARRHQARNLRRARVRKRVRGTAERPRMNVYRSERHIYVQVISDETGETLLASSTLAPDVRSHLKKTTDVTAARTVGELIGKRCIEKGITSAVFDRNGFLYHGRIAAVADGARAAGLRI